MSDIVSSVWCQACREAERASECAYPDLEDLRRPARWRTASPWRRRSPSLAVSRRPAAKRAFVDARSAPNAGERLAPDEIDAGREICFACYCAGQG